MEKQFDTITNGASEETKGLLEMFQKIGGSEGEEKQKYMKEMMLQFKNVVYDIPVDQEIVSAYEIFGEQLLKVKDALGDLAKLLISKTDQELWTEDQLDRLLGDAFYNVLTEQDFENDKKIAINSFDDKGMMSLWLYQENILAPKEENVSNE